MRRRLTFQTLKSDRMIVANSCFNPVTKNVEELGTRDEKFNKLNTTKDTQIYRLWPSSSYPLISTIEQTISTFSYCTHVESYA